MPIWNNTLFQPGSASFTSASLMVVGSLTSGAA